MTQLHLESLMLLLGTIEMLLAGMSFFTVIVTKDRGVNLFDIVAGMFCLGYAMAYFSKAMVDSGPAMGLIHVMIQIAILGRFGWVVFHLSQKAQQAHAKRQRKPVNVKVRH